MANHHDQAIKSAPNTHGTIPAVVETLHVNDWDEEAGALFPRA
jgi:hypothetical protein